METQMIITAKEKGTDNEKCPKVSCGTVSPAQARANQKWRDNNRERYNARCLVSAKLYYEKNKEAISAKQKERRRKNRENLEILKNSLKNKTIVKIEII